MNTTSYMQTTSGITWYSQQVLEHRGRIGALRKKIPRFKRSPFAVERGENKYLDLIVREPLIDDQGYLIPSTVRCGESYPATLQGENEGSRDPRRKGLN